MNKNEQGMSGVMSDDDYFRMMSQPLGVKTKCGPKLAYNMMFKYFGKAIADKYKPS